MWLLAAAGAVALIVFFLIGRSGSGRESVSAAVRAGRVGCHQVDSAFQDHRSGAWVTMRGRLIRLLTDAGGTSTHQRFILACQSQTVLIENNVDVGRRALVRRGEVVIVSGQYIWNRLGGLIHDTHRATGSNPNGWIEAGNKVYE